MPTVYFDDDPQPSRFVEFDDPFVEFDDEEDTPWWKRLWGSMWQGVENVGQTGLSIATLPSLLAERATGRPGIGTQAQQEYGAGMGSLRSALGAEEELKGEGTLGWLAKTGVESLPWMALPGVGGVLGRTAGKAGETLAAKAAQKAAQEAVPWATRGLAEGALFTSGTKPLTEGLHGSNHTQASICRLAHSRYPMCFPMQVCVLP